MVRHAEIAAQLSLGSNMLRKFPVVILSLCGALALACDVDSAPHEVPVRAGAANDEVPISAGVVDTADLPTREELRDDIQCPAFSFAARSLSRALRPRTCALVQEALSYVRGGNAQSTGVAPGDTVLIGCALVARPFVTSLQDPQAHGASVSFGLPTRDFSILATFAHDGRFVGFARSEPLTCADEAGPPMRS
jgi:hypothetical protein